MNLIQLLAVVHFKQVLHQYSRAVNGRIVGRRMEILDDMVCHIRERMPSVFTDEEKLEVLGISDFLSGLL